MHYYCCWCDQHQGNRHQGNYLPILTKQILPKKTQVLRGGMQPVLAATRSTAHMDILVPDLFFRYSA